MGQAEAPPRRYTAEDYFALEEASDVRHEFFEGEVCAMAGASIRTQHHCWQRVYTLPPSLARQKVPRAAGGRAAGRGRRPPLHLPRRDSELHPHDQRESQQPHSPVLLVEVLSPSTEAYDRSLKFNQHTKLPSLRHYLLVAQKTWLVEWYQLTAHGVWNHSALAEAEDAVVIPELGLTLTLAEAYEETGVAPMRVVPPVADPRAT